MMDEKTTFLRHTLASLAYRAGKPLRHAPPEFATFRADPTSRTPVQIVAHMGDLFDWALTIANGQEAWHSSQPLAWDREVARFFHALEAFDARLASEAPVEAPFERLIQGPIADALTHVGQLAMLRRMSGAAVHGENYFVAEIVVGRVGLDQAAPVKEF
jgi:hypothetical protein